ncbi:MAG: helix-turn-helix transcriptional regulator [Clostridia bacterium]|nr:helix-turn-helix transcriptional regulator [Clostridia bacterium]
MTIKDEVVNRVLALCKERQIKPNELANISGITPSTIYSLLDERRRDVSVITVKKICDGLAMTIGEFFSTEEFNNLDQEIK